MIVSAARGGFQRARLPARRLVPVQDRADVKFSPPQLAAAAARA